MQIDWLTVAAQIVNFLVLVWLLKYFLYRPVTAAMARREERIAERVDSARAREDAAERERERLHERMQRLEDRRDAVLEQAREEAEDEKQRLLDAARTEVDDMRKQWQQQLHDEQDAFFGQLRRDTAEGFADLARRALGDLADASLEGRIAETLGHRLTQLGDAEREHFRSADELDVATGFELDDERRAALTELLRERLGTDVKPSFQHDPNLVCGIALTAAGRRLAWSLADYLDGFERQLAERLDRDRRGTTTGAETERPPEAEQGQEAATA